MKPPLVRQATFDEAGKISSVPGQATERPNLEGQGDLFNWKETDEKEKRWTEATASPSSRGYCDEV